MASRTIDYAVKIRVNPDQKGVDLNVKHSMVRPPIAALIFSADKIQNPFDEIGPFAWTSL